MSKDRILGFYDFSLCADFLRDVQIFLPIGQKPLCFLSSVQILLCWTRLDWDTQKLAMSVLFLTRPDLLSL